MFAQILKSASFCNALWALSFCVHNTTVRYDILYSPKVDKRLPYYYVHLAHGTLLEFEICHNSCYLQYTLSAKDKEAIRKVKKKSSMKDLKLVKLVFFMHFFHYCQHCK